MKAAIISRGPVTFGMYPGRVCGGYDVVIGVCTVVHEVECDWWAIADTNGYRDYCLAPRKGEPRVWTWRSTGQALLHIGGESHQARWREDAKRAMFLEDCRPWPLMPEGTPCRPDGQPDMHQPCWTEYSGLSALGLAWTLEAGVVDCYGVDMAWDDDFQGHTDTARGPSRWQRERGIWFGMCQGLADAGMIVRMARLVPASMADAVDQWEHKAVSSRRPGWNARLDELRL
jgi:hypothetical protein